MDNSDSKPPPPPPSFMQQMANLANEAKNSFNKTGDAPTTTTINDSTVSRISKLAAKSISTTVDTGKQVYGKIAETPVPEQVVQWTNSAVQASKQTYRNITGSTSTEPSVVRFTGATVGSAITVNLWFTALGSRAAREALRAACIRSSIRMYSWLHLPASLRAAAVASGVHANKYIVSGIVPGVFTVWALYDGYRLVRFAYQLYDENKKNRVSKL